MALKPLKTEDSTYTFFDDEYREAMHSLSGAYREALYMHVLPSRVLEKEGTVCVLDVGLGLGYNVLALLYEARKRNANAFYHIVSFEKNPAMPCTMETIMFHDDRDELYKLIRKAAIEKEVTTAWFNHVVLYGDARKLIASMPEDYFDAVFHDPFSPAKNPELWTVDFLKRCIMYAGMTVLLPPILRHSIYALQCIRLVLQWALVHRWDAKKKELSPQGKMQMLFHWAMIILLH